MSAHAHPPDVGAPAPAAPAPLRAGAELRAQRRRRTFRRLRRSPAFLVGLALLLWWVAAALVGPAVVPESPIKGDVLARFQAPSAEHWFGTDQLGRDVFSRVICGSRDVLAVAPFAALLGTVAGTVLGLLTGYLRGIVDTVLSRVFEAMLALPLVILALLALVALGPSRLTVIVVIGVVFAPVVARTVRAAVLAERDREYVAAARLRDERAPYIMFVEILPNVIGPVAVEFTVRLAYAVFTIATLSFLGFGIQPPSPDWGLQVAENYAVISAGIWWPTLFPALAIATLVVGVNLVADAVQEAFDG